MNTLRKEETGQQHPKLRWDQEEQKWGKSYWAGHLGSTRWAASDFRNRADSSVFVRRGKGQRGGKEGERFSREGFTSKNQGRKTWNWELPSHGGINLGKEEGLHVFAHFTPPVWVCELPVGRDCTWQSPVPSAGPARGWGLDKWLLIPECFPSSAAPSLKFKESSSAPRTVRFYEGARRLT